MHKQNKNEISKRIGSVNSILSRCTLQSLRFMAVIFVREWRNLHNDSFSLIGHDEKNIYTSTMMSEMTNV